MANSSIKYPIQSVMKNLTVDVQIMGYTRWRMRQWLGIQLLKLAGWVMGCHFKIEVMKQ